MTTPHDKALKPCPFCGGEAAFEQTGKNELTLRCVGVQPSGLRGCGPKYVQKGGIRFTLEWLQGKMTENWNRRAPLLIAGEGDDGWRPIDDEAKSGEDILAVGVDAYGTGHYEVVSYEITEGAPWMWHTHDGLAYHENAFSHYRLLPAPPSIRSDDREDGK